MAPSLKLYYFDMAGRAEPIRMIFACGEVPYNDYRFAREQWATLKQEMPYGQVPVLEVDGKKMGQSIAICRYAAQLAKLDGDNAVENLEIDGVVDTLSDIQKKLMEARFEKDESKKATLKEQAVNETLPNTLKKLEAKAASNGGYIATKKLTWADVLFLGFYESVRNFSETDVFASYPNLVKVKQNVLAVPSLKGYIQKRKDNPMNKYDLKSEL